jgi:DNA-binding transcriptional regulator GbsR (MarR family)
MKTTRVPPELEDVASQVGEFIEYWGFKNVHGRIWTHLFLSDEPLDAGELIERLGISKALVSMSISDLLEYEVIQLAGKGPKSTATYRANPDVTTVIANILRKRERRMLGRVSSATRQLRDLPKESRGNIKLSPVRLDSLMDMIRTAEGALDGVLKFSDVSFEHWSAFNCIPEKKSDEN